ncbi:MAG TPA: FAD-binding oxidoreductase [Mycobacteriales bacterium]|nr:FAD-binding oxidoreductase [Mycobacteriales bacterium]
MGGFSARFGDSVLRPGDQRYETERRSWHLGIDPRPAFIAEPTSTWMVRSILLGARDEGLPVTVQSTGHGTYVPAGGVLMKTGRMNEVEIDPLSRTATVGPGVRWSDVLPEAAWYGLAPLSGTAAIGVTGYTLGGGAGFLSRQYGFAADSVVRAEVVTADGRVLEVDAEHHPDLFWALRGGGGNFGIVTSLQFRLYPVRHVYAGMSIHPVERAGQTLRVYRDWAGSEPDESNSAVTVLRMPDLPSVPEPVRGRRVLVVRALYAGTQEAAERVLAPVLGAAGPALVNGFGAMDFAETATMTGPPPPPTAAVQGFELIRELSDQVIDAVCADHGVAAAEVRHWGGAMGRPGLDAGPIGHRDVPFSVLSAAPYEPGGRAGAEAAVARLTRALGPAVTGGSFLNFLTDAGRTRSAYTAADYRRLAEIKAIWDPDNVFAQGHAIAPAASAVATAG